MGKSSRTKRRASVRTARKSRGNGVWYAAAALVVVAGIALIVISRDDSADAAPQKGDHWHAAFGVNVCGEWIPNAPEFEDAEGIHTHDCRPVSEARRVGGKFGFVLVVGRRDARVGRRVRR